MRPEGSLSFFTITGYLALGTAAFALLLVLTRLIAFYGMANATLLTWVLFYTFCGTVAYCCVGVIRDLFPRWLSDQSGTMLKEVMEIEGRV